MEINLILYFFTFLILFHSFSFFFYFFSQRHLSNSWQNGCQEGAYGTGVASNLPQT